MCLFAVPQRADRPPPLQAAARRLRRPRAPSACTRQPPRSRPPRARRPSAAAVRSAPVSRSIAQMPFVPTAKRPRQRGLAAARSVRSGEGGDASVGMRVARSLASSCEPPPLTRSTCSSVSMSETYADSAVRHYVGSRGLTGGADRIRWLELKHLCAPSVPTVEQGNTEYTP